MLFVFISDFLHLCCTKVLKRIIYYFEKQHFCEIALTIEFFILNKVNILKNMEHPGSVSLLVFFFIMDYICVLRYSKSND